MAGCEARNVVLVSFCENDKLVMRITMKRTMNGFLFTAIMTVCIATIGLDKTFAQQSLSSSLGVAAYPSKGQSTEMQNQDEGHCFEWAKQQTGVDPFAVANTPPPASGPAVGGGERLRGAARGAVGGAAVGAIVGDAGKGAGVGAAVGTMAGGRQARQNKRAEAEQVQSVKDGAIQSFNKAFCACMEGRGYVVK
jgi:YMGG-like Gly-zipper